MVPISTVALFTLLLEIILLILCDIQAMSNPYVDRTTFEAIENALVVCFDSIFPGLHKGHFFLDFRSFFSCLLLVPSRSSAAWLYSLIFWVHVVDQDNLIWKMILEASKSCIVLSAKNEALYVLIFYLHLSLGLLCIPWVLHIYHPYLLRFWRQQGRVKRETYTVGI